MALSAYDEILQQLDIAGRRYRGTISRYPGKILPRIRLVIKSERTHIPTYTVQDISSTYGRKLSRATAVLTLVFPYHSVRASFCNTVIYLLESSRSRFTCSRCSAQLRSVSTLEGAAAAAGVCRRVTKTRLRPWRGAARSSRAGTTPCAPASPAVGRSAARRRSGGGGGSGGSQGRLEGGRIRGEGGRRQGLPPPLGGGGKARDGTDGLPSA